MLRKMWKEKALAVDRSENSSPDVLNKADVYNDSRFGDYRVATTDGSHRSGEMELRLVKFNGH